MRIELEKPGAAIGLEGIEVPGELYWVLRRPVPLAGMRLPRERFPWASLAEAGFSRVVALHPASYDPAPLAYAGRFALQDLAEGAHPEDEASERENVRRAVAAALGAWRAGHGVVVHCLGGCGRTGTVLGCLLRELGLPARDVLEFLDRTHKARGMPGWPESEWQRLLVERWPREVTPDAG